MGRLSGPLLDRIDLHVEVPAVPFDELTAEADGTSSAAMRDQVLAARTHDRILRVARTVADLAGSERVETGHVAEVVGYRTLDRKLWLK